MFIGNPILMNFFEHINDAIGAHGIEWNVEPCNKCYLLIPDTQECCVHPNLYHVFYKMSCIKVYKHRVVCYCSIHGERVIESKLSLRIRSLFFVCPKACKQKTNEDFIL